MAKSGNVFVKAINILKFYSNGIPFSLLLVTRSGPCTSVLGAEALELLLLFSPLSDKDDDDDERKFILPTLHRKLISCKHTHNSSAIWMKRCDPISTAAQRFRM